MVTFKEEAPFLRYMFCTLLIVTKFSQNLERVVRSDFRKCCHVLSFVMVAIS